ncbi:hypothetical protein, partial [Kineococcus glutinatus]|uniref:hypothetical protein n=1 Tax=Kineococcus glutinatus TaxID=1070872 RepID=UPI0031EE060C
EARRLAWAGEDARAELREDGDIGLERSGDRVLDVLRDLAAERGEGTVRLAGADEGLEETVVAAMAPGADAAGTGAGTGAGATAPEVAR